MGEGAESREKSSLGTAPLWAELDAQVVALERSVARGAQVSSVIGIALAVFVSVFIVPAMGRALAIASAIGLVWFSLVHALLTRGWAVNQLRWITPVVELSVPGAAIVVIARTQGAAYAMGSWVPPLLFAFLIILSVIRLRPRLPLVIGMFGAAEYFFIYWFVLRREPRLGHLDEPLYRPAMQATRAATIVLYGALGTIASIGIRRAVGLAARRTRAKEIFGKYRIGKKIASGGMGTVFEALYCPEGGFERRVAIKRVHPHLAEDPAFVNSFREEAELGARLAHPNIVAVFDFGREGDTYFFAMEYVDGMDLLRLRKRCAAAGISIPSRLVALIGREIAEGLVFAHEIAQDAEGRPLHVVHRDLNPSNILVSRTGQVKISDFGVAKALHEATAHETKNLVGKLAYLSPELARGAAFDERIDLFALGLVLWELLCLRPAFAHESDAATLNAVVNSVAPPPSLVRPDLAGSGWDAFCTTALQPDASRRFASARDASAALARILEQEGVPRPDELSAFLRRVETAPETPDRGEGTTTKETIELPTINERR